MDNAIKNKIYTYADYKAYPENERIELIDGQIFAMTPAPSRIHQELIAELVYILLGYIKANKGECKVFPAPFDVILNDNGAIDSSMSVVQPDISVVCDRSKFNDRGCFGAPDLIIEVVSPFNPNSDYVRKLNLYDNFKVKEYWIINPMEESIFVYTLGKDGSYAKPATYTFKDRIRVGIFDNLFIDFHGIPLK